MNYFCPRLLGSLRRAVSASVIHDYNTHSFAKKTFDNLLDTLNFIQRRQDHGYVMRQGQRLREILLHLIYPCEK
jgi:hypothetical protein